MTSAEQSILEALNELDAAVRSMATAHPKPDLRPLFTRIDALSASVPPGSSPDLLHYLQKKSYEKARLWLLGREAENRRGACGH